MTGFHLLNLESWRMMGCSSYSFNAHVFPKFIQISLEWVDDVTSTTDDGSAFQASITLWEKKMFSEVQSAVLFKQLLYHVPAIHDHSTQIQKTDDQYFPSCAQSCKSLSSLHVVVLSPRWLSRKFSIYHCSSYSLPIWWLFAELSLTLVCPSPGCSTVFHF